MPVKKPTAKKTPAKKTTSKKAVAKKKPKLVCEICGYEVIVDKVCGCVEEHALICCGTPMSKK
jgi:hypothetical protein